MKKLLLIPLVASTLTGYSQKFNKIPEQYLKINQLIGIKDNQKTDTIPATEISDFITYKEYKKYLESVKKDSSKQFYQSQLPDTNITINDSIYQIYITSKEYDDYPVLGISWDNAMNYCRWKTLKDNEGDRIDFIYRLPHYSEWLSAYEHFKLKNVKHDLDKKYSDWLINAFDESVYNFQNELVFGQDYEYLHTKDDPAVLKRKKVVGESYRYEMPTHSLGYPKYRYGYAYMGYQQISFRIVKTKAEKHLLKYWGIKE